MAQKHRHSVLLAAAFLGGATGLVAETALAQQARISEETRVLATYPFSEPNPVPILASDTRLYPYHRFEGYAHESEPVEWKVVHLENDFIEVWVLPEVGGKVWGARVKETGHEFIYRNEVMKFRNIALRGPWTSGGIEFNFGVIGHTPATATPVDYATRENSDGSVSVFVGTMDLPSRTRWRVEVRLPADRAYFETNVLWHNPTPLEQPYYNWMTAAAFAQDDLLMSIPGDAYLGHPGEEHTWPVDPEGRRLSVYDENRFGGSKSFHVVGELNDFFGGYYLDDDYGFGHWARYEEMPGQKLWLWALSRQGGIWEDLLTDTDGQYVEFQAGRLLVQYSPGDAVNPISQVGFDPGATDRWTETWFPVEGLGGLTDASRDGAMFVSRNGDWVTINVHAFGDLEDVLVVSSDGVVVEELPLELRTLVPSSHTVRVPSSDPVVVQLPALGLEYHSDPAALQIDRPFATDDDAMPSIPLADRQVTAAEQLVRGRRFEEARPILESVLADEPWNRDALLALADLDLRQGRYDAGLAHADRALRLDAYDDKANFVAGNMYRALGRDLDAQEAFGWSARSVAYRSASYVQLAELELRRERRSEAARYARLAIDYDRYNLTAYEMLAIVDRLGDEGPGSQGLTSVQSVEDPLEVIRMLDPLHHFVSAERYLAGDQDADRRLLEGLRSEYPDQEILELATSYVRRGRSGDAARLLELGLARYQNPLLVAWLAWLETDPARLNDAGEPDFAFPYRPESLEVLRWAADQSDEWSWTYLLALALWGRDRPSEAGDLLASLEEVPDFAPFYVSRSAVSRLGQGDVDPERDLRRAVALAPADRTLRVPLIRFLQAEGRWEDALAASSEARAHFPGEFNLDLLHAQSLNETMRYEASIEILDAVEVLPSENASAAHRLYAEAHTMAALYAIRRGQWETAVSELEAAMLWPERLGQGRPYEPEERLQRYLLGVAQAGSGDQEAATAAFMAVVESTQPHVLSGAPGPVGRLDLLAIPSLLSLERPAELTRFAASDREDALSRITGAVRSAASTDADPLAALRQELDAAGDLFGDVEGRLLYGALILGIR